MEAEHAAAGKESARVVRRFVSASADATEALGAALGALLQPGAVVALDGELGSGKTCIVRGIARALGVTGPVTSPTFTLMHQYAGRVEVRHLDAWMHARGEAFLADGGAEWLGGDGVALVEWAEHVRAWLPLPRVALKLAHAGGDRRAIEIAWLARPDSGGEFADALAHMPAPPGIEDLS
jgi:tRNA threonylcarbamoyladenosine biosynthesis protein TsaE